MAVECRVTHKVPEEVPKFEKGYLHIICSRPLGSNLASIWIARLLAEEGDCRVRHGCNSKVREDLQSNRDVRSH